MCCHECIGLSCDQVTTHEEKAALTPAISHWESLLFLNPFIKFANNQK